MPHFLVHTHFVLAFASVSLAQEASKPPDPVTLVARAEQLCAGPEKEDAVLLLWDALDQLVAQPVHPARDAAILTARSLLKTHDPLHADRIAAFAAVAKAHVEIAVSYRGKKWFEVAAECLDFADRFDRDVGARERVLLAGARPKGQGAASERKGNPLFRRDATARVVGPWKEGEELLECGENTTKFWHEWTLDAVHADCELSVEFRGSDPKGLHDAAIIFGADGRSASHQVKATYNPDFGNYTLAVFAQTESSSRNIRHSACKWTTPDDGFHRLVVRIRGKSVRAQLDDSPPLEVTVGVELRGRFGLVVGTGDRTSLPVTFRNFRHSPLPDDEPTDAAQREQAQIAAQGRVLAAIDKAQAMVAKKQPEPAAQLLRQAQVDVARMSAGLLRDNLAQSIEKLLAGVDSLTPRRKKAAQDAAKTFVAIADRYAAAGWPRAAQRLVVVAAEFDPAGFQVRLAAAQDAVDAWGTNAFAARAAALAPPPDDGTVLRELFAQGSRLLPQTSDWLVEGACARTLVATQKSSLWMPRVGAAELGKVSVHVQLAEAGVSAGLCCEALGANDYATVRLVRGADHLVFEALHVANGTAQQLLAKKVPLEPWRLDGWFPISLERTANGISARCGDATLELGHDLLPAKSGRFGLYAGNDASAPVSVEFRAFQIGP